MELTPPQPRPRWRGFSFALHPDTVQGFYFARMQYSPIQAFTARFVLLMQLYHQRHKTAHRVSQRLFLRLRPLDRPQYQTDTSGYNTICATLEGIHAPGRAQPISRYRRHSGTPCGSAQPPIIIRYIRGCRGAPVMDPCQTVQHTADHASRGAPVEGSARRGSPAAGARRGTIGGYRRISFRAFAQ